MKLGKIRKLLGMILAVGLIGSNVFAEEIVNSSEAVGSEESSSISVEASTSMAVEEDAFSEDAKIAYLQKYGQAVGQSVEKDNVRVTVERLLADAYTWQMLMSVETVDGKAFKGDSESVWVDGIHLADKKERDIETEKEKLLEALPKDATLVDYLKIEAQFNEAFKIALEKNLKEDGTLDMDGFRDYVSENGGNGWGSASSGYGLGENTCNTASKRYFIYQGSCAEAMSNEWLLQVESVKQQEELTYDVTKTVVSYLEAHKNDYIKTESFEVTDEEKEELEELKLTDKEWYEVRKEELENKPKHILAEGNLKLAIIPEDTNYVIDNIGFIDQQLHMRFKGEGTQHYNLDLSNNEEWVMDVYNDYSANRDEEGKEDVVVYRVYDIKDVEALKNYKLTIDTTKVVEETTGLADIALNLEPFAAPKVITVNQKVPYYNDKEVMLQDISIRDYSLVLNFTGIEKGIKAARELEVKLKDGTSKKLHSNAGYGNDTQETCIYALRELKQEEIVSILWGDKEITLQ